MIKLERRYTSAANVNGATRVIYSSAIPVQNPEIVAARQKGIDVLHRSEVLAQLLNNRRGIAVSGAHGKTTVTSMIALCLEMAGTDPTVLIGAHFAPFGPGAKYGRGEFVVAEADESDGSFLRYRPEVSVVTSIEADHLENYNGTFESLIAGYRRFLSNCQPGGLRLIGMDHPVAASISQEYDGVTYGFSPGAHWRAEVLQLEQERSVFRVFRLESSSPISQCPGRHNVQRPGLHHSMPPHRFIHPQMQRALRRFTGAKRRFEILGTIGAPGGG